MQVLSFFANINSLKSLKNVDAILDWVVSNHAGDIVGDKAGALADTIYTTDYQYDRITTDPVGDIAGDIAGAIAEDIIKSPLNILEFCLVFKSREAVLNNLGLVKNTKNYNAYVAPLIKLKWLAMLKPESPTSPLQRYRTTLKGAILLKLLQTSKKTGK